jgi:hypothetical protein
MGITAVAKFSHLSLENNSFAFGSVYVGKTNMKTLTIKNESPVFANYKIRPVDRNADSSFIFSSSNGCVPPQGSTEIQVTFTPSMPKAESIEYFDIVTVSGNTRRIECRGFCKGKQYETISHQYSRNRPNCIHICG